MNHGTAPRTAWWSRGLGLTVRWDQEDAFPWVSPFAACGLVAATLLAIFGMPPVNLHGPLHFIGIMDPFCGMTRGIAATMRGDLPTAWRFNPASPLILLTGVATLVRSGCGRFAGRWLTVDYRRTTISTAFIVIAVVALEINQQVNADLLMA